MTNRPTPTLTARRIGPAVAPSSCMMIRAAGMPAEIASVSSSLERTSIA
jgi:hypothetical protein